MRNLWTRRARLPRLSLLLVSGAYGWSDRSNFSRNEPFGFWDMYHGGDVFVRTETRQVANVYHLPVRVQLEWFLYLLRHPRDQQLEARASWANILNCLGAYSAKSLLKHSRRADIIPSALDAPPQTTSLHNIGIITMVLQRCTVQSTS